MKCPMCHSPMPMCYSGEQVKCNKCGSLLVKTSKGIKILKVEAHNHDRAQ